MWRPSRPTSTVIDDFESGDLSAYDSNPAGFDVQQSTTYQGTYALHALTGDSGTEQIYSSSGLNHYPSRGETISFRYRRSGVTDERFFFGFAQQGSSGSFWNSGYYVRIDTDRVELVKDNSSFMVDTRPSYTFPTGEWTRIEVGFGDSTNSDISISHYDASGTQLGSTGTITDTDYDSGNVQWAASASLTDSHYADYAIVP